MDSPDDFHESSDSSSIAFLKNEPLPCEVPPEGYLVQIGRLVRIGTALSAERNIGRLLEMIVDEARKFTRADGGTLYTMSDDETHLQFAIVQNETLGIRMGGTGGTITWAPVSLRTEEGRPNHGQVSSHVALTGETVNIPDVYSAAGFDFQGTRLFDGQTGYRSRSMLVLPMRNHENDIIGVLQLLNARDQDFTTVIPFSREFQEITECLASQAAVALSNSRLIHDLESLMDAFIRSIATAVDEKSPYMGDHVRRVADLTMAIARRINTVTAGPLAKVHFSDDDLKELRFAAWLHDVGKIATPEHVIDKASKLETISDGIELLRLRFELCRLQEKCRLLGAPEGCTGQGAGIDTALERDFHFLQEVNQGNLVMSDAMIAQLLAIATRTWERDGKTEPLLTEREIENLTIRQGTLNQAERQIVENHAVVTYKILSQLPFPKKLKRVPEFAASHHETPDGRGYPRGIDGPRLPLQARILGLADIFEALTAKDRPYKKGKTLSQALAILKTMVDEGKIDQDLFDLFTQEGLYMDYARRELSHLQIDFPLPEEG